MILDIILVVLILLSVLLGYKKGFVKTGVSLVALIISIVVTGILYVPISNFVVNVTNIDETIEAAIYKRSLNKMAGEEDSSPKYLQILTEQTDEETVLGTDLGAIAVKTLSINIVKLGVFIILLIATRILLRFITSLTKFISSLPILKQFDKIGGIIYGLLRGLVIVYITLIVIQFATKVEPNNIAYKEIQKTTLTKMIYENNIINIFFKE